VIFTAGGSDLTLSTPLFGYETTVRMPLSITELEDGIAIWDSATDGSLDARICKATLLLSEAEAASVATFFNNATYGRGEAFVLNLGATASGFFPFGPDKGDIGSFTVQLIEQKQIGIQESPRLRFLHEITLALVSAPSYSLPAQVDDGPFQIGTVDGLRFPVGGFRPDVSHGIRQDLTRSGVVSRLDLGALADTAKTEFDIECRQDKAAALIVYLTSTSARGVTFTMVCPVNSWPFGAEYAQSGSFNVALTSPEIKIKHDRHNGFFVGLSLFKR
jgi:hypothetical protein